MLRETLLFLSNTHTLNTVGKAPSHGTWRKLKLLHPPFLYHCLECLGRDPFTASMFLLPATAPTLPGESAHLLFAQQLPSHEPVKGKGGKKLSQLERASCCCPVDRLSSQVLWKYIWMGKSQHGNLTHKVWIFHSLGVRHHLHGFQRDSDWKRGRSSSRQCFLWEYPCAGLRLWSEILWGH